MQRSGWFIIALFAVVVLAGCGGVDSGSDASVSSTPTTTSIEYPPGATENTIVNRTQLFRAHQQALEDSDYIAQYQYQGLSSYSGYAETGQQRVNSSWTIRSNLSAKRQIKIEKSTFPISTNGGVSIDTWYNEGGVWYVRYDGATANGTAYDPYHFVDRRWAGDPFVSTFHTDFTRPEFTYTPVYTKLFNDHTPHYEKTFTKREDTYHLYTVNATASGNDTIGDVLVRSDGFITRLQVRTTINGTAVRLVRKFELRDSVPVDEVSWEQRAISEDPDFDIGSGGDVDCDDFSTQWSAQNYHESTGGAGLDGDSDGRACEHLP